MYYDSRDYGPDEEKIHFNRTLETEIYAFNYGFIGFDSIGQSILSVV